MNTAEATSETLPARRVERLEVDELPRRRHSRLMVELAHDGLGQPVRVPVLVARGEKPGAVFGLTAVVHGNELNGVRVIHRLFDKLDLDKLRGSIAAAVVVNMAGFFRRQRGFSDGTDLNHIMPGSPQGNPAMVYAHRFVERFVTQLDYLVDLHTASSGRINSLYVRADMHDDKTAQMAYLQRPEIIVHNPPSDHTLRGTADERGIPAITVEIGNPQRFQPEYVRSTLIGLRSVLAEAGMLPRRPVSPGKPPILCERSYWLRTDHGGLLEVFPGLTERIESGQVIARLSNAFGDVTREYRAPQAGVVIGKNVDPVAQTGDRILHLGIVADEGHDFRPRAESRQPARPRRK